MNPPPTERLADIDTQALYRALEERRHELGISWRQVSRSTGVGLMTLSRLSNNSGTPNADNLAQLLAWLGHQAFWYRTRQARPQEIDP